MNQTRSKHLDNGNIQWQLPESTHHKNETQFAFGNPSSVLIQEEGIPRFA